MKTDMPFYGVQKPDRVVIYREMRERFPITTRTEYTSAIEALWAQPHREDKYTALHIAFGNPRFITPAMLPLYRRLIIDGAWWDLVDDIATRLVGRLVLEYREKIGPKMDQWIEDGNMWIRRSALICHVQHKAKTNYRQMFRHCVLRAGEKEFFIRKAIGWTLRQYAWTEPDRVAAFLLKHREKWSGLTFREAAKHLELE